MMSCIVASKRVNVFGFGIGEEISSSGQWYLNRGFVYKRRRRWRAAVKNQSLVAAVQVIPKVAAVFQSVQIDPAGGETDPRSDGISHSERLGFRTGWRKSPQGFGRHGAGAGAEEVTKNPPEPLTLGGSRARGGDGSGRRSLVLCRIGTAARKR
ncbi:hypothetical protein U1Q18_006402 [Sarracenia purpurea var. burkii]